MNAKQNYEVAMTAFRAAAQAHRAVKADYRAGKVSDADFLASVRKCDAVGAWCDAAEAAVIKEAA